MVKGELGLVAVLTWAARALKRAKFIKVREELAIEM